jgi:aspartate/methionine/tyrosine aminotransferase
MRDFALEIHFSRWEFKARYNLAGSEAESWSLGELLAMADAEDRAAFNGLRLGYTETFGAPVLRAEIARGYDSVQPDQLLCFAGAEEAIYVAMQVLLAPDDHAIVLTPNYQAAETLPLARCAVTGVPLDRARGWDLDLDRVRAALRPTTRLISINFPNNPTGRVLPQATFGALVDLCRERGIWPFSDEVYRLLERDPAMRLPQAVDAYERGISLNVMSKAYGLPGLRIGWLACRDRSLLLRCERYKHYLSICNAGPSELLALIALKARAPILDRNRAIIERNLILLDEFFGEFADLFDWRRPEGGCVGCVGYRGGDGVEAFTARLAEEAGILLLPASVYRSDLNEVPADFFRIGFGRAALPEGIATWRDRMGRVQPSGQLLP